MSRKKTTAGPPAKAAGPAGPGALLGEIREMIEAARGQVAQAVNAALTLLYWRIGDRIRRDVLGQKRAEYGEEIVSGLSEQLSREYGRGFGKRNLFRMVRFAEAFPDPEIVSALLTQLSWTHFLQIIPFDDPLKRQFYAEMCRVERWSTRALEKKIGGMLFERTALSKKPARLAEQELKGLREEDRFTPDLVFRDPYLLDFLGLQDSYAERDLESAILREMEAFLLELGVGFCFVARQKRMQIDDRDYYLDLLFYHRRLRRLVAIDLKLGEFDAADKGQMELYLSWLKRHEQDAEEGEPLGIILCAGKRAEHVELLEMEKSRIHVAEYLTKAVPREQLEQKLHEAVQRARKLLDQRKSDQ